MKLTPIFNKALALPTMQASMLPLVERLAVGACRDLNMPKHLWQVLVNKTIEAVKAKWPQFNHQYKANVWIYSVARNVCIETMNKT